MKLVDEINPGNPYAKSLADVAVHELMHAALPNLTDPVPAEGNAATLHNFKIPLSPNADATDVANAYNIRIAELLDENQIDLNDVLQEYVYRKIGRCCT